MDKYKNVVFDMGTGYTICKDKEFKKSCKTYDGMGFYNVYHNIICDQMDKNNILAVNGLIRWIDYRGYYPDNGRLYMHAFVHGEIGMFLMIYYICLFWENDGDYGGYIDHIDLCTLFEQDKNKICATAFTLNETGLLIGDVIRLIMEKQLTIVDYKEKRDAIDKIYNKYGTLDNVLDDEDDIHNEHHSFFIKLLLNYDVNILDINEYFHRTYKKEIVDMEC